MTDTELNIALAEWAGTLRGFYCGHCREERDDNQRYQYGADWFCNHCDKGPLHQDMPSYTSSLDAIHELEMMLKDTDYEWFCWRLSMMLKERLLSATASQRAEALAKTLGVWKEETK